MEYCETCKYRNPEGYCNSEKLDEDFGFDKETELDMLIYSYTEGGAFWVGPHFGCVHHEPK